MIQIKTSVCYAQSLIVLSPNHILKDKKFWNIFLWFRNNFQFRAEYSPGFKVVKVFSVTIFFTFKWCNFVQYAFLDDRNLSNISFL